MNVSCLCMNSIHTESYAFHPANILYRALLGAFMFGQGLGKGLGIIKATCQPGKLQASLTHAIWKHAEIIGKY